MQITMKQETKRWGFILIFGALLLAFWLLWLRPWWLTQSYGKELALAVEQFRETEKALETRLHPNLILSVATENYLPTFLTINRTGMCETCDRFWITTTAKAIRIRVMEYSPARSRIRAEVVWWGHRIDSRTYERLTPNDVYHSDIATYVFIWDPQSGKWMLEDIIDSRIPDLMNPTEITLDDFLLFDWGEIKSDE